MVLTDAIQLILVVRQRARIIRPEVSRGGDCLRAWLTTSQTIPDGTDEFKQGNQR